MMIFHTEQLDMSQLGPKIRQNVLSTQKVLFLKIFSASDPTGQCPPLQILLFKQMCPEHNSQLIPMVLMTIMGNLNLAECHVLLFLVARCHPSSALTTFHTSVC